jgi:VWFA-related protein
VRSLGRARRLLATSAVLATVGGGVRATGALAPSDPQATFRTTTSLVEVDVIVKDRDGRFVPGLTADDFEVLEDGRPQRIQHFYLVTERPAVIADPLAHVVLPREPDQSGRRVFLFMFDSEHLSAATLARLKQSAMDFVSDQLRPGDLAGVFTNGSLVRNRLTNVHQEVLDSIRSATTAFESPETRLRILRDFPRIDSEFEAIQIERGDKTTLEDAGVRNCAESAQECSYAGGREFVEDALDRKARLYVADSRRAATSTLDSLTYVIRNLSRLEGRKTLLLMSEGLFFGDAIGTLPIVAGQAARAGVTIYSVDARGTSAAGTRTPPDASLKSPGLATFGDTSGEALDILAQETGGVTYRHTDDYCRALDDVAADTSTYYVLAYSPENAGLDGKFRKIGLRVKWEGVSVRARRGYVATPLPPPKALRTNK